MPLPSESFVTTTRRPSRVGPPTGPFAASLARRFRAWGMNKESNEMRPSSDRRQAIPERDSASPIDFDFDTRLRPSTSTLDFDTRLRHSTSTLDFDTRLRHSTSTLDFDTRLRHSTSTLDFDTRLRL